ncbi:MAG: 6,7-dimethyl-8-ribityllumazine synthase [Bacteroidaceae bacterium]|nr:6,7-dimethyl-8-ribityllumazine synthase [Bacteroidaceae bacterium]MBQ5714512.1 6,7-dimethyl-8-ribityllumazine synthase [Bacteroidaceae bacterium]
MASSLHNLSDYNVHSVPDATGMRVGIVVSEWNEKITGALLDGACKTLMKHGVREESINIKTVPGSFELVYGAARFVSSGLVDVVIAIGCVIRGDTPHFDYICQGVTQGLADLNKEGKIPVIYGLLTCNTLEQAQERCGGMLGNKGDECAVTAIKMVKGWE